MIEAIDLFCGAGGLTRGLRDAGIVVKAGYDTDPACEYAYEFNNPGSVFENKSVEDVQKSEIATHLAQQGECFTLLCGCAPCQTFSSINQKASRSDSRWYLLSHFGRLIEAIMPDFVTMENVPGLLGKDVFVDFCNTLSANGYSCSYSVLDCSDYGLPQKRRRLVLLASRHGQITMPSPEEVGGKKLNVRDAIEGMLPLAAGETDPRDSLHTASKLSAVNLARIRASVQGGTWRDWDDSLKLDCHIAESGDGYGAVYGRMCWDDPSPTITTQFYNYGSGRFGHPDQDRAISLREGALLQTFPLDYQFYSAENPLGKRDVARLIGNAVPVSLGKLIGSSLLAHAENYECGNLDVD